MQKGNFVKIGSKVMLLLCMFTLGCASFMAGLSQKTPVTLTTSAGEEALLQKESYIQKMVSSEDELSHYAVGKKASELDNFSLEKLKAMEAEGIKVVISSKPSSYIDTETNTVYISLKSNEGQVTDFVNDLLAKL